MQPVAGDHHVGGALVLDLEHGAGVRLVRRGQRLGHHPVEPGALELLEPLRGLGRRRSSCGSGGSGRSRPPAPPRAGRGGRRTAGPSATRRRPRAGRTPRTTPGSARRAWRTRESAGWIRSCSRSNSSRSAPTATKISPSTTQRSGQRRLDRRRRPRGSSGSAAWCCGWPARPRRRRGTRCTGSRPTSARRAGRRRTWPGRGSPFTDLASIGWTGGITGRSTRANRAVIGWRGADLPVRPPPSVPKDRLHRASWCRRRGSPTSASTPTGPTRRSPSQRGAVEALRGVRRLRRAGAADGGRWSARGRTGRTAPGGVYLDGGFGVGKTHLLASLWHAAPGAEAVRHLRRAHPPGRGARVPRRGGGAVGVHAGLRRRVRARRPRRHGAGVHAADAAARGRRPAGRDVEHAAGQARRGPVRRRRLPARDPGAVGALRRRCGSTARTTGTAGCPRRRPRRTRRGRAPRRAEDGASLRPLRRPRPPPRGGAPQPSTAPCSTA